MSLMGKYFFFALIALALLGAGILWMRHSAQPGNQNTNQNSLGNSQNNTQTFGTDQNNAGQSSSTPVSNTPVIEIHSANGGSMTVKDFTWNSQTVTSPHIPGHYFLAGGLDTTNAPYSIFFVTSDQSFTVTILQEPIGFVRQQAEQALSQILGVSAQSMCALRYSVLVPADVNQSYAGKNLGFSFCPGATPLP
jgi:hypothetical protein